MIEQTILSHLVFNESYAPKVVPFLKADYFSNRDDRVLFELITGYIAAYKALPTKESLFIDLDKVKDLNEDQFKNIRTKIAELKTDPKTDEKWLLDRTEEFCSWQAIKNALFTSIRIVDGKEEKLDKGSIPKILQDALAVSFDTHVGHDFIEDWGKRFEHYHDNCKRVECDLTSFNRITRGGFPSKSLNVFMAGTYVGKSLVLCHLAASNLAAGYDVLYITLEMSEIGDPSIAQRIDANLMDIALDELALLPRDSYAKKIERLKTKIKGKLIIKEYPTATAGANHFRYLLNELRLKKNFVPDIVYVDYLTLCTSTRVKHSQNVGPYSYFKSVAEELRGLAQEFDIPIVSAAQLNRAGFKDSDAGMDAVADSWGLPQTADFLAIIFSNEQLERLGQFMLKVEKNRFSSVGSTKRFVIGVDKKKMRLFDIDSPAQQVTNVVDIPIMGTSAKFDSSKFDGFK